MVGASVLELVSSLPPHPPPQASTLVSLKEETKFPHGPPEALLTDRMPCGQHVPSHT